MDQVRRRTGVVGIRIVSCRAAEHVADGVAVVVTAGRSGVCVAEYTVDGSALDHRPRPIAALGLIGG